MSGSIIPLAAFQASTDGRFCVSPEAWENNFSGQLGYGNNISSNFPVWYD